MKTTRKERLKRAIDYLRLQNIASNNEVVASKMKADPSNVSRHTSSVEPSNRFVLRFNKAFDNIFNDEWLLNGEGEMLRSQPFIEQNVSHTNNTIVAAGNNSGNVIVGGAAPQQSTPTTEAKHNKAPVVPSAITRVPNLDVLEYVRSQKDGIEMSRVILEDIPVSCWYKVENSALSPRFMPGDMVALTSTHTGMAKIIPGNTYAVDCKSVGVILRIIFEDGNNLRAHSLNPAEHPDFTIEADDIIRIYRVMGMVRFNA